MNLILIKTIKMLLERNDILAHTRILMIFKLKNETVSRSYIGVCVETQARITFNT